MQVKIKQSKTDPFRQGCFLTIAKSASPICSVMVMKDYILQTQPPANRSLFTFYQSGSWLTRSSLTRELLTIGKSTSLICSVMAMKDYILQTQPPANRSLFTFYQSGSWLKPHQGAPVYSRAMWLLIHQLLLSQLPHWSRHICSLSRYPFIANQSSRTVEFRLLRTIY